MILPDLPMAEYHTACPKYLSKTTLKEYDEHGPAWWHAANITKTVDKRTPNGAAQGLALDCMLTEGAQTFSVRYMVRPASVDLRTKDGKQWANDHADKLIMTEEDFNILMDAAEAVSALPAWAEIEQAKAQVSLRRDSEGLGLGLQSRPDWLDLDRGILWDLKKTRDLSQFGKQAINLGYHLQAAIAGWCLAGERIALEKAYLVAVEWEPCARARIYQIPQTALTEGDRRMRDTAAQIAARLKSDDWTDVQKQPEPLDIPAWMLAQMEAA